MFFCPHINFFWIPINHGFRAVIPMDNPVPVCYVLGFNRVLVCVYVFESMRKKYPSKIFNCLYKPKLLGGEFSGTLMFILVFEELNYVKINQRVHLVFEELNYVKINQRAIHEDQGFIFVWLFFGPQQHFLRDEIWGNACFCFLFFLILILPA